MTPHRGSTGIEISREEDVDEFRKDYKRLRRAAALRILWASQGYIGFGTQMHVRVMGDAVLKIPRARTARARREVVRQKAEAHTRGRGRDQLEQMVGYSLDKPQLVTRYIPGESLLQISPSTLWNISDDVWARFAETLGVMHEKNVSPDASPANFIYNPEGDLHVIDYEYPATETLEQMVARVLQFALVRFDSPERGTPEHAEKFYEQCGHVLGRDVAHAIERRLDELGFLK